MAINTDNSNQKEDWDRFVLEQNGSFLQSWEWGEFQEKVGRKVFRFSESGWLAEFIEFVLPMGKKYWYGPRAPLFTKSQQSAVSQQLERFIEKIKVTADKEEIMFFRISPEWSADIELEANLEICGFKKLRYNIEPAQTLILDISQSEKSLLTQMHAKWRYNIGLARKKGVKARIVSNGEPDFEKYFEDFWHLMQQTSRRQKIRLHEKEYYRKQLTVNSKQFQNSLFVAEYKKNVVAANIVNFYNQRATYLHGGSDNEQRALMAPHLLQWEQIRVAKKLGGAKYDFWGIDEKKWPGVTRFKLGFGGEPVKYVGTWDYPLDNKWYLIYRGVQKFRR